MKKLLSISLCLLLVAALAMTVFAAGSVTFSYTASDANPDRGDTVTLTVNCASTAEATSYGLKMVYDSDVFEVVTGNCAAAGAMVNSFKPETGFAFMFVGGAVAYEGQVGTVTLKIKEDAPGGTHTFGGVVSVKNGSTVVDGTCTEISFTLSCDHNYGAWTEGANGHEQTCTLCGNVVSQPHSWDAGVVTTPATCTVPGVKTFSCTVCSATKTEPIAAPGHSLDDGVETTPATCTNPGVMTYSCENCDYTETESIDALGHDFSDPAYVDENNHAGTCDRCGETTTEAHIWDDGVITDEPTCQEDGVMLYTCTVCNGTKEEVIAASDEYHVWGDWTVTVAPSYESTGLRVRECTLCDATEEEEMPVIVVPPTGDNSQLLLLGSMALVSVCGLCAVIFLFNDKKKHNC